MSDEILAGAKDQSIRIRMLDPEMSGAAGTVLELPIIYDVAMSFNETGLPAALDLWTYKDAPGAARLQEEDMELQVDMWDPRENTYKAMEYGRFMVGYYNEDRTRQDNPIHYQCPSILEIFNKVRLDRASGDYQLNNAYDKALEKLRAAERPYERALEQFEDLANRVKRHHGLRGSNYAYYGVGWISRSRKVPHGSLASNATQNGRLYYYSSYARTWRRLSMNPYPDRKEELMELGVEVADARHVYNAARDQFDKAERAARETSRDGRRFFHNSSPGRTIARVWGEGILRDQEEGFPPPRPRVLKGRSRTFNNANSSNGNAWPRRTRTNHDFPLGTSLLQMMLDFQERGLADFRIRGGAVDMVPAGSFEVDQSDRVNFLLGRDLTSAPTRGSRMHHYSVAMVVGGDGYSRRLTFSGGVATKWGYWEDTISEPGSDSISSARELTLPARTQASHRYKTESTFGVTLNPDSPIPMLDYHPGHWISVWDHDGDRSRRKINQIVIQWSPDQPMKAIITLDDRFSRIETVFSQTMSKTLGGVEHLQGHIPRNPSLEPPESVSEVPRFVPPLVDITATIRVSDRLSGIPTVVIRATFADPGLPEPEQPNIFDSSLPTQETDPGEDGFEPED